jgi:Ca2+-transporting ATPase
MAFAAFMMTLVFLAFNSRYLNRKITYHDILANKHLNRMAAVTIAAIIAVINLPQLQSIFNTVPLGLMEWAIVIGLALLSTSWFHLVRPRFGDGYASPS